MIHSESADSGPNWRARGQRLFAWLQPVVVVAAILTLPLTIAEVNGQEGNAFVLADWIVWLVFVVEYAVGLL